MSDDTRLALNAPLQSARLVLTDARYFWLLAGLVVAGDAALTALIVRFVPYTEIDFTTYMAQMDVFYKGERDYSRIAGPTGPLVYPAGHVLIHRAMYALTDGGKYLERAQAMYGALYVLSLAFTCALYRQARGVPNWVLLLLPLSKRLHSIFALRMFNDCWALVVQQAALLAFGAGADDLGCVLFSFAVSIKMSVILYLPALLLVLFKRHGFTRGAVHVASIALVQVLIGLPFLLHEPRSYLAGAFDLGRVFLYKWTVNWRFVPEDVFLSRRFATALMVGHLSVLAAFALGKWCRVDGGAFALLERGLRRPGVPAAMQRVSADHALTLLMTSNLIGIAFARSLHYQFYSWYAQQLPLLAWRTRLPVPVRLALLASVEYAWNVYPSTNMSSGILLAAHMVLILGIWFGWPEGKDRTLRVQSKS
ncbi:glycosyltransferase family 58 protein [Exidia glandulosa HHB12029]|uniref:Dol-P-Man:Man(5)GlcNAc(2)-PP-Dol alpha-1,3-mannosyltransferase n=1 Tax=Exidia glandulosa HHB12029 TaxID=1314781 RepID=A0A165LBV3_EXIGL|nr:glycosyltransferase family 58 protein [Exidia glandulosa HHB12029]